ncbi:PhzF family phenazine biosynthesis protein [Kitasatospora azatica]|uniref:PhzF family phenazine biosynthesis protein n=1 Tax=Kitasatospora azatica TaxID=58347 RepID=UPI00055BF4A1|nr:PhzF family phenazine biosynthesis isomerase [Kitasatospora azatica]
MPEVVIVDACQRNGAGGSPTAVLDDAPFTDEERCRIPTELGTSHAVFLRSTGTERGQPSYTLRFFTAQGELPACGHGTLAALALLAEREGGDHHYRAVLRTAHRSFDGRASRSGDGLTASFDPGPVSLRNAGGPELKAVAGGLGLTEDAIAGDACVASNGRPRLLLPVRSRAALAELTPDFALLRAACDRYGLLGCYAYSPPDRHGRPDGHGRADRHSRAAARMFAPSIGLPEDIANANSTACLTAHAAGFGTHHLTVDMGDHLGSPSTITATVHRDRTGHRIHVGGQAAISRMVMR